MKEKWGNIVTTALITVLILAVTGLVRAGPLTMPNMGNGSPTVVSYQGQVVLDGTPYDGTGTFKFAVVDADGSTTYWSNDGSSSGEPGNGVSLTVIKGLFNVLLGDLSLEYMDAPLEADVFDDTEVYLRVWFSNDGGTFVQLNPDRRIAAVPYALQAQAALEAANADTVDGEHANAFANATHSHTPRNIAPQGSGSGLNADMVDGLHASQLETHYQNVVVVAKSGGDYTSVQAAINSITDAAAGNPYLVWVAPGVYQEQVTMKPYVHLQGAGQEATLITSTASNSVWPPTQATLLLASDASLRDLTVGNSGTGTHKVALMATAGVTHALAMDVTALAQGGGTFNIAIVLRGIGVSVTLQQVTALGENGSTTNMGLNNNNGAAAGLHGGAFTGRGGTYAYGIYNADSDSTLEAESVTALAENGSNNFGLYNYDDPEATLRGGSFTGRGGIEAHGIFNSGAMLVGDNVTALGENGSSNYGLSNFSGAKATLSGGSFTGRGGMEARGIFNVFSNTTLKAESVTALGENGYNYNHGLHNDNYATSNVTQSVLEGATKSVSHYRAISEPGRVTISNSRLAGGAADGIVTCVLVTRGTTVSTDGYSCP